MMLMMKWWRLREEASSASDEELNLMIFIHIFIKNTDEVNKCTHKQINKKTQVETSERGE